MLHAIHQPQDEPPEQGPTTMLPAIERKNAGATAAVENPFAATAPTARR
jgi:hypothetical protein